ncbi:MAG TPA: thiamine pyrophosphate-dependent enzyme, partial [Micromonosporaceae bacterium]|nr:thiamine pyrophosphate-dependent enzyme [Micromonosporaceae bacterium]
MAGLPVPDERAPGDRPLREGTRLTGDAALELFDAQLTSRHLDLAARWLRSFGEGFYTIGSSGHEGNAAVAAASRPTDPALLHYRSGAFYCARAAQREGTDGAPADAVRDVLRGVVASSREALAGGRHKVFGHPDLNIVPTTSTVASHLPRAVGVGFAIERARRMATAGRRPAATPGPGGTQGVLSRARTEPEQPWPEDAVVIASFGDASVNHASATAAFNTAGWCDHSGLRLPVLFVCEDNGLGISVRSPDGWVGAALRSRPGLRYVAADGLDLPSAYDAATDTVAWVRRHRRPAVLHLRVVRLMGHAGADAEIAYRSAADITRDVERDPVLATARLLISAGLLDPEELLARYDEIGWQVRKVAEEVLGEPKLADAAEVLAPLAPRRPVRVARAVGDAAGKAA